jgi:hypothetical protein
MKRKQNIVYTKGKVKSHIEFDWSFDLIGLVSLHLLPERKKLFVTSVSNMEWVLFQFGHFSLKQTAIEVSFSVH